MGGVCARADVSALLVGSVIYDRASQLDRALLVVGLLLVNGACWTLLALAELDAPAAAWVRSAAAPFLPEGTRLHSVLRRLVARAAETSAGSLPVAVPRMDLSDTTKTALASIAGATIALPSSLPFAIFCAPRRPHLAAASPLHGHCI
jgi:hypothetical protein